VTEIEYHVAALDVPQLAQPVGDRANDERHCLSWVCSKESDPSGPSLRLPLAAIGAARSPPAALHMNVLDPSLNKLVDDWKSNHSMPLAEASRPSAGDCFQDNFRVAAECLQLAESAR